MSDTWKTVIHQTTVNGDEQLNVFYHNTTATIGDALLALEDFVDDIVALMKAAQSVYVVYSKAQFYRWVSDTWRSEFEYGITGTGSQEGAVLPAQNAAVIVGDTGVKRVRPKKFIGGTTIQQTGHGELTDAAIGLLVDIMNVWITTYTSGAVALDPGTWRKALHTFVPIIAGVVDSRIGSQRHRKPGVGD